jgi:uncharacterized repeat protein (TIGR02543 family)
MEVCMKKQRFVIGMLALALIMAFAFTACEDTINIIGGAMLVNNQGQAWVSTEDNASGVIFKSDGTVDEISEVFLDYWTVMRSSSYFTDGNKLIIGTPAPDLTFRVETTTLRITNKSTNKVTNYAKRNITLNDLKVPTSATPLTNGQWKDDNFTVGTRGKMYSFPVTYDQKYYVWWNEEGIYGDNTKTQDVTVYTLHSSDKSSVPNKYLSTTYQWFFAWDSNSVMEFTALANGTMYLWVTPAAASATRTGTFAIAYSTTNTRPEPTPEPSVDPALNGTWVDSDGSKMVLNNGTYTQLDDDNVEMMKGTYSTSGNDLTFTVTQISGASIGGTISAEQLGFSKTQWYTQEQFRTTNIQGLIALGSTQADAEAVTDELISFMFVPHTGTYTLNGDTMTFTYEDQTTIFTKQGSVGPDPTYTVTFNSNGGSTVAAISNVAKNTTITQPTNPTKANNAFGGWYKEAELTTAWNFTTDTVTSNIELHAKWLPTYTVTFNSNGGSTVADIPNVTSGATITKPTDPTKDGYTFGGWYKEAGLTNAWNFTTDTVTVDIALHAKWTFSSQYAVGDTGPGGGKIFYVSTAGFTVQMQDPAQNYTAYYLEGSSSPITTTNLGWMSSNFYSTNMATEEAIGTGRKNTALILARDPNAPAAKACNVLDVNGKTDWFLPSRDELDQLYANKQHFSLVGTQVNFWSSSQQNSTSVYYRDFNGGTTTATSKTSNVGVFAIRAF